MSDEGLPEIDTCEFEVHLQPWPWELNRFRENRPAFVKLVHRLISELQLHDQIEHLKIHAPDSPDCPRAEMYRNGEHPWPSKRLCLAIYSDRYMDEQLLRHELGHEADRRNPKMLFDPQIHERWKDQERAWALDVAANISLDARLGEGGLGKQCRRKEFRRAVGKEYDELFEEAWANPSRTWPEIEALANRLLEIRAQQPAPPRPSSG